jgi:cardiolipin synthase
VGHAFVDALTDRARAGVRVRLLMDRVGTLRGPHKALARLRDAGGEVVFFSPFLQWPGNGHLNLRNHRKMVIADHARAFAGGMNIGAHYLHEVEAEARWTDLAYLVEGRLVTDFHDVFRSDWEVATGTALDAAVGQTPAVGGDATVQLVPSGPDITEDPLHDGMVRALHMARSRIWIATPYFVPTEALGNALRIAARRGVDVQILLPLRSNQRMADFARGAYLREMRAAGVTLRLYTRGMLHAKAVLVDDAAAVGSANFDVRSMLLNFELMLFAYDAGSVAALSDWFTDQLAETQTDLEPAGLLRRLAEGVFRLGAPIL